MSKLSKLSENLSKQKHKNAMSLRAPKEPAAKKPVAKGRAAKSKAAAEPQADAAPEAPKTRARRATGQAKWSWEEWEKAQNEIMRSQEEPRESPGKPQKAPPQAQLRPRRPLKRNEAQ